MIHIASYGSQGYAFYCPKCKYKSGLIKSKETATSKMRLHDSSKHGTKRGLGPNTGGKGLGWRVW